MTDNYIAYTGKVCVSLGALKKEYVPLMMRHINDTTVAAGVLMRPPITLEAEQAWFEENSKRNELNQVFAVLRTVDANPTEPECEFLGIMGLRKISWSDGVATTGSILYQKESHGKGYGTEAKLLMLYHAFYIKGLRKVSSEVKAFNGNSWGHLLKCGYREIGRKKRHHFHLGEYVDDVLFEVFREDFEPIWELYQRAGELPTMLPELRASIDS